MIPEPVGWTYTHEAAFKNALSRPDSEKGRLQRAALLQYRAHAADGTLPTSNRFLFYELEQAGAIDKTRTNLDGTRSIRRADTDLNAALTVLRDNHLIPWSHLVDESRTAFAWEYAATIGEYLHDRLADARIDAWDGEPPPVVICESRSLAGVLRRIAADCLCPIVATNGQSSGSLLHNEVRPLLDGKPPVLYLGDLDLAGGQIEASTRDRLAGFGGYVEDWQRVAITAEQVAEHDFAPIVKLDKRFRDGKAYDAWETESLGQAEVERLLLTHLDRLRVDRGLDPMERVLERERVERDRWAEVLDHLTDAGETS